MKWLLILLLILTVGCEIEKTELRETIEEIVEEEEEELESKP